MQGHRLVAGEYQPIGPLAGQIPSASLSLRLERDGTDLRLVEPGPGRRIPTRLEAAEEAQRQTKMALRRAADAEDENRRLRREIEELRRKLSHPGG